MGLAKVFVENNFDPDKIGGSKVRSLVETFEYLALLLKFHINLTGRKILPQLAVFLCHFICDRHKTAEKTPTLEELSCVLNIWVTFKIRNDGRIPIKMDLETNEISHIGVKDFLASYRNFINAVLLVRARLYSEHEPNGKSLFTEEEVDSLLDAASG